MKRVYVISNDHPKGYRGSRTVTEQKTARVEYQDTKTFKAQCVKLLNDLEGDNNGG